MLKSRAFLEEKNEWQEVWEIENVVGRDKRDDNRGTKDVMKK